MNKAYRVKWNEATNSYVAVPETAKGNGKGSRRTRRLLALIASGLALSGTAMAADVVPVRSRNASNYNDPGMTTVVSDGSTVNLTGPVQFAKQVVTSERKTYAEAYDEGFVIEDNPFAIQRDDGAFILASNPGTSLVVTGSGDDTVHAGFTTSEIHLGAGNDTVVASKARATYDGGAGSDTVDYRTMDGGVVVDLVNGTTTKDGNALHTLMGIENVIGTGHADTLIAGDSDSILQAGEGNDVLIGGSGASTLDGGDGSDTADYSGATDVTGVVASLASASTQTGRNGYGGTDTFISIENLIGSRFDDVLEGDGGNNKILAGAGNDVVLGSGGSDELDGGEGTNTLDYTAYTTSLNVDLVNGRVTKEDGVDRISNFTEVFAGTADDVLVAVAGATLHGGDGNDRLVGSLGSAKLDGGAGSDTVDYSALSNSLYIDLSSGFAAGLTTSWSAGNNYTFAINSGSTFNRDTLMSIENVIAGNSTNYIVGSAADNVLTGGKGTNYMAGGVGNNVLNGTLGGYDYALYTDAQAGIVASLDASKNGTATHDGYTDTLIGMEGIWGSSHDDVLTASSPTAKLFGGRGNDTLTGGTAFYQWGADNGVKVDLRSGLAIDDGYGDTDTLINVNNVTGTNSFDDTIWGNNNNNVITEYGGNNTVYGSKGNDTLNLGAGTVGNNTVDYSLLGNGINADLSLASATVNKGASGRDTLTGVSNITGTAYSDTIIGNASGNTLVGGGGADTLIGNGGNDILIGGTDMLTTASYSTSPAGIVANLATGQVDDGFGGKDTLIQIAKILGSASDDRFTFSSQVDLVRYEINGGGGNDAMVKQGGAGTFTLDASTRISGIASIDFADGRNDRIDIDLNGLVSGSGGLPQNLTIHTDAADTVTINQTGWTMTENAADHQTWTQGANTVVVAH